MRTHEIELTTGALDNLLQEKEVVDIRLNEPAWVNYNVGDELIFIEDPKEIHKTHKLKKIRRVRTKILGRYITESFEDLLETFSPKYFDSKAIPRIIKDMNYWRSKEEIKEFGVLGLKVRVIKK